MESNIKRIADNSLNSEHNFDNCIVEADSQNVYDIVLEAVKKTGTNSNPVFIYGRNNSKLTYLVQAIENYLINNSNKKLLYVTGKDFITDYKKTNNSQNNSDVNYEAFRSRYRNIDVLIIDGIQYLSTQSKAQEEFFNIFNSLWGNGKKIIITSNIPLDDLNSFENRLLTRFNWGTKIAIQCHSINSSRFNQRD